MLWNVLCCWPCCVPYVDCSPDSGQNPALSWEGIHDVTERTILRIFYWILTSFIDFVFFVCFIGFWFCLVIESLGFLWTLSFSFHSDLARNNLWKWIFLKLCLTWFNINLMLLALYHLIAWMVAWKNGKSTFCAKVGYLNSVEMCVYEFAVRLYGMLYFS